MPTSEVLDASADFLAASSPDAAAAAKLRSTPAAAIFAGDEAGMGVGTPEGFTICSESGRASQPTVYE